MSSIPNTLSRYGAVVRNIPLMNPAAKFFLVGPSAANWYADLIGAYGPDESGGNRAFATLTACLADANVVASRGDVIFLLPGFTQTISSATAITISLAGIKIVGIGDGNLRPKITIDTANTSTINVTANGVSFTNVVFVANFLAIASLFTLTTATDFQLMNCEFRDTSSVLNFLSIVTTDTTSNDADGLLIDSCKMFLLATSGAVNLVTPLGTNNRWKINNCYYASPTTNAGAMIPIAAGKILTNLILTNNYFNLVNATGTATGYIITTNGSTNTGFIDNNMDHALPTTPLMVTASSGFVYGNNFHSDQADTSGYLLPVADA